MYIEKKKKKKKKKSKLNNYVNNVMAGLSLKIFNSQLLD